jgi:hypothetical protein
LPLDARTVVADDTARDAIAAGQRFDGLTVYVIATNKTWQMQGGSPTFPNANWVEIVGSSAAGVWTDAGTYIAPTNTRNVYVNSGYLYVNTPGSASVVAPKAFHVKQGNSTTIPAGTSDMFSSIVEPGDKEWTSGSNVAQQIEFYIGSPTYSFTAAPQVITDAVNVYISGQATAGANCTITNNWAFGVNGKAFVNGDLKTLAQIVAKDGTVASPAYSFGNNTDTGLYYHTYNFSINSTATALAPDNFKLIDTGQNLAINSTAGYTLAITGGTNAGESRTIVSNTVNTFTVSLAFTSPCDATSVYTVTGIIPVVSLSIDSTNILEVGLFQMTIPNVLRGKASNLGAIDIYADNLSSGPAFRVGNNTSITSGNITEMYNGTPGVAIGLRSFTTYEGALFAGYYSSTADFPLAMGVFTRDDFGAGLTTHRLGVVGEALANSATTKYGTGVLGLSKSDGAYYGAGISGLAFPGAAADSGMVIGGRFVASGAHDGYDNVAVYADASGSYNAGISYSFYGNGGYLYNSSYILAGSRLQEKQGADVNSASTIALGSGNSFELLGTTAVDLITGTGWQEGSLITLFANENVTINHGTATSGSNYTILLAGAGNFAMTANDSLTLRFSSTTAGGVAWREVGRCAI